ncbi:tRNA uridine-5-carboxymethylaminomethyl(34) synthesis GTPase MnmE [Thiocapsa imhoffii]|uniref:tRNA modification GTPase MnmE n=1 Tax=Thiocapsa imhoffii TaxID=382777 RepID=A0A9X0WI66_9GAMM|nr:tRNA uridine-5-carboxymethylaminomethyl(34) synthesis GTPase MnmE [Thiocapsa imhoffii]MBK1645028.1 tRNA uridine-5-carboxymethylaminomethyl(34) synthesis GTPase MnmE [Thiocapsa imhoffii]
MTTAETIVAVATPPGMGGVGVVRISGPGARDIATNLVGRLPKPRLATLCVFRDAAGDFIDQGLALFFPGPHSFTGEDVLELQGHGGPVVMDLLLQRCLESGARLARAGEFTERAFLNGKLDLAQAEAVADLIESTSALGARLAGRSLQGVFSEKIETLREHLMRVRAFLEATLDFPDEELDLPADFGLAEDLRDLLAQTQAILDQAHQGCVIREGLAIVLAGPPNAGKSSLLNALAGQDAAIVTPIPGTTRDPLKLDIRIDGLPLRIVDTAGLRHSEDLVEQEGVRRAQAQLGDAELVLWVRDVTQAPDSLTRDSLPPGVPVIRIINKIDLMGTAPHVQERDGGTQIALSVKTGAGLDLLRSHLKERAGVTALGEGAFVARRRHLDALRRAVAHLEAARSTLEHGSGPELVAEDLLRAATCLGEITGQVTSEDLLGSIFSTFCIGK